MRRPVSALAVGSFFIAIGAHLPSAQAQVSEQAGAADASPAETLPSPAGTSTKGEQEAAALLDQAKTLFQQGQFREALPMLERAYALTGSPRHLFNLGVLHHKLSECEPAREYFERYLAEDPQGNARSQADWALQELNQYCPAPQRTEQAPDAAPVLVPEPPEPARKVAAVATPAAVETLPAAGGDVAGGDSVVEAASPLPSQRALIFLGAGAVAGVAALVSLGLQNSAQNDIDALHSRAAREGEVWDTYEAERVSLSDDARLYRPMSILLGIGFGALAGTGAVLWILDSRSYSSLDVSLTTRGVSCRGRF